MNEFIWSLPGWVHEVIKAVTGYILVAQYDQSVQRRIGEPYWRKWEDYLDDAGNWKGEWWKV